MVKIFLSVFLGLIVSGFSDESCFFDCKSLECVNSCNFSKNAPYKIELASCPWNISVTGSYLYWTTFEDGLITYTAYREQEFPSVIEEGISFIPSTINLDNGEMDCDYHSAFKVGITWETNCDNWDLSASYIWFHHSYKDSYTLPETITNSNFYPKIAPSFELWSEQFTGSLENPSTLASKWDLGVDVIDVEVGRKYYLGHCFILRPAWGLRNSYISQSIKQKTELNYNASAINGLANGSFESSVTQKTSSWGIGPRGSIDCKWLLGCGFSLIGRASTSLLYTDYTLDGKEKGSFVSATATPSEDRTTVLKTNNPCALRPYFDMGSGLSWETYLNCHCWYLNLYFGYDFMALWNQNMFSTVRGVPSSNTADDLLFNPLSENLYLYGLTFSATFNF